MLEGSFCKSLQVSLLSDAPTHWYADACSTAQIPSDFFLRHVSFRTLVKSRGPVSTLASVEGTPLVENAHSSPDYFAFGTAYEILRSPATPLERVLGSPILGGLKSSPKQTGDTSPCKSSSDTTSPWFRQPTRPRTATPTATAPSLRAPARRRSRHPRP